MHKKTTQYELMNCLCKYTNKSKFVSKIAREAARKAREAARNGKGKEKKDKILSGKLAKATGKDAKLNELFLVEGDSAGGSAIKGRNNMTQAILPLRGKVLNTEKASSNDIHANEELNTLIYAIGAGVGQEFDPEESNYGKMKVNLPNIFIITGLMLQDF